jgi:hypothetical protein
MKHLFRALIFVLILSSCQKDEIINKDSKTIICESDRYVKTIFNEVTKTTVKFGSNINTNGINQDLYMDVYEGKGDTLSKRPVIIIAFGGSFISGDRNQQSALAKELAGLGYVSACIDYRLLSFNQWPIDSIKGFDIAIKASGDMKASIRHFRKDAATTNLFKIDPDFILIAGISAGAIAAVQTAYFDTNDNIESHVKEVVSKNGGIEGSSGDVENLKYSSKVSGVINLSGAIYRPYFMDTGEVPIVSFHGDKDDVVPYGYDFVRPLGIPVIKLYGSFEIDKTAKSLGIKSYLQTANDGGHEDIYTSSKYSVDFLSFKFAAYSFCKEILCL